MSNHILYGIVVERQDGGQTMDSYVKKESALKRSGEIIKHIKDNKVKGMKVYLSELDYDKKENVITASSLVNEGSELLYKS